LVGNGSGFNLATLTAGANISITNGAGTISIAASTAASGVTLWSGGSTGLTPNVPTSGSIVIGGTLGVANGGTGQTTEINAINALLPSQGGNSGKYLTTNGSSASWGTVSSAGTVTNVAAATVAGMGLSFTGSPITTTGTLTLGGTLSTANGGTGLTTVGTNGQVLASTGSAISWTTLPTGPALAGPNTWTGTQNFSGATVTLPSSFPTTAGPNTWTGTQSFSGASSMPLPLAATIGGIVSFVSTGVVATTGSGFSGFTATSGGASAVFATDGTSAIITRSSGSLSLDSSGNLTISGSTATKPGSTSWVNPSDINVKKNVADYTKGLAALETLRPISYQYNGECGTPDDGKTFTGFVAQEVQTSAFPEMVSNYRFIPDRENPDVFVDLLALDQSDLTVALVNAVKELNQRLKALENA